MEGLKTGTPPRLLKSSINWNKVEMQSADKDPVPFSYMNKKIYVQQIKCGITRTNLDTHKIISDNITSSPVFSGFNSRCWTKILPKHRRQS